jgi:hypothetical protein
VNAVTALIQTIAKATSRKTSMEADTEAPPARAGHWGPGRDIDQFRRYWRAFSL